MKVLIKIFTICIILLFQLMAFSQDATPSKGKIIGKVLDSVSQSPINYATITLMLAGNSKVINGTTTDTSGNFLVDGVTPGNYKLVVEFIGYKKYVINNLIINKKKTITDVNTIVLHKSAVTLNEVQITAPARLLENKLDKLVYNAEKDITSQTGVATDILKKVPQVSVDVDGNVELQGSGNILFLINGKPSTIFGTNISDVLQAIPANQIKSIEVITNPGAKYDAQGTGGIINIILKHSSVQGMNGNLSLTTGTIVQNGSVNINARKGKFGINAFANGNARLTTTTTTNVRRVSTDTVSKTNNILQQDGSSNFNRHGFQAGTGFDWSPGENNDLSGAINYSDFGVQSKGSVNQSEQIQLTSSGNYSDTNVINRTQNKFKEYSFDPSLNYKHTFKNKDQEIEIGLDGSFSHNLNNSHNNQYLQPQDSLIYGTTNNNPATESEYEARIDYTQPFKKDLSLGVGAKFSGYDISSAANASLWNFYADKYLYNVALSNNLNYHQKVYATYAELSFPVSKTIQARLGGRYERTQVNSFYANAQQTINKGYNTFIPSFFMMKKINDAQTFKLNFTVRINRPQYYDLNPFINVSDPKNISTGNPDLKPEVWHRYEASYNYDLGKTGSFMITLFYRQSNGDIQQFIVYYPSITVGDTVYNNASVTTRENIGVEKNAGTNLFFEFHVNDKFNVRSNIILFHRHTINKVDQGYNSTTTIYRFNINTSYQFTSNFAAEFFGNFNSRHHEAQGYYPSMISYSFSLRKQFWNKKGSLALTANNFFSNYINQRTNLYGPGFVTSSLRKIPFRSVGINFTWKFGKLVVKKEKTEDNNLELNAPPQ